jgi:hypothetical protein
MFDTEIKPKSAGDRVFTKTTTATNRTIATRVDPDLWSQRTDSPDVRGIIYKTARTRMAIYGAEDKNTERAAKKPMNRY